MQFFCVKTIILVLICATLSMANCVLAGDNSVNVEKSQVDKHAALVNGKPILQSDFDVEFDQIKNRYLQQGQTLTHGQEIKAKKEILESLINQEILYQQSVKKGVMVDKAEVAENIGKVKARFPSEAEFEKAIASMNLTSEGVSEKIKRSLAVSKLIDNTVGSKISVSDDETKAFYDGNPSSFSKPEQVKASHILVKVDTQAKDSEKKAAKKKITDIQTKIKTGEEFSELAKANSDCPSGAKGGDLGYFGRGSMVKPFEEAAFSMKPGEISDIVETQFGYHLIKLNDKKEAQKISYLEAKENIKKYLKRKKTDEEVNVFINGLKENAEIIRYH